MRREVVQIDEAKCDGCGLCVPSCAEGAIQIVDGKARLIADVYCDGLGACLGECPQDAITIVEREAEPFDEEAVRQQAPRRRAASSPSASEARPAPAGCPGSMAQDLQLDVLPPQPAASTRSTLDDTSAEAPPSGLCNWPVQLHLVQPNTPFLQDADLLLVADCVPFALADFHKRFLYERPVVIGCPKLDDPSAYVEKLAQIITAANIQSITVVHMEVPCCTGLVWIVENALRMSGSDARLEDVTVSIRGQVIEPSRRAE